MYAALSIIGQQLVASPELGSRAVSPAPTGEVRLLKLGAQGPGPEARSPGEGSERGVQPGVTGFDVQAGAPAAADAREQPVVVPSFAEVFKAYSGFVWRVLLRLGVAESDVDDVAQEVFLGVHRNLQSFEGRCALRTWIYGICHRRAIDYRRRAMARPELATDEPPEVGTDAEQEDGLDLNLARAKLTQLLDSLDEEKRSVFVLFEVEGIPMEEVAEIVGCPLQTAYSRLYAARKKVDALAQRMRAQQSSRAEQPASKRRSP